MYAYMLFQNGWRQQGSPNSQWWHNMLVCLPLYQLKTFTWCHHWFIMWHVSTWAEDYVEMRRQDPRKTEYQIPHWKLPHMKCRHAGRLETLESLVAQGARNTENHPRPRQEQVRPTLWSLSPVSRAKLKVKSSARILHAKWIKTNC